MINPKPSSITHTRLTAQSNVSVARTTSRAVVMSMFTRVHVMGRRALSRTLPRRFGLEEFFDAQRLQNAGDRNAKIVAGRAWSAAEMRLKSNEVRVRAKERPSLG